MSGFQQNPREGQDRPEIHGPDQSASFETGPRTREQFAQFMLEYGDRIRRRVRGKVRALKAAGAYVPPSCLDEDDILSTVMRRADAAMVAGSLRTDNLAELYAYINTIADNAFKDRLHDGTREQRSQSTVVETKPLSTHTAQSRLESTEAVQRLIEAADSDDEQALFALKCKGAAFSSIAAATGRSCEALRTRWSQLRHLLLGRLTPPQPEKPVRKSGSTEH